MQQSASSVLKLAAPPRLARHALLVPLALGLPGCKSAPELPPGALKPPPVCFEVSHFAGTPLSGRLPMSMEEERLSDALQVRVTFLALEDVPVIPLEPVVSKARLVAASRGGLPVLPSSSLLAGVRLTAVDVAPAFLAGAERGGLGPSAFIARGLAALPQGVTAAFSLSEGDDTAADGLRVGARLEVQLLRAPSPRPGAAAPAEGAIQAAVLLQRLVDEPAAENHAPRGENRKGDGAGNTPPPRLPGTMPPVLERELVILDAAPSGGRGQIALFIPSPFRQRDAHAIAAVIEVAPPEADAAARADLLARCRADVELPASLAPDSLASARLDKPLWPGLRSAIEQLGSPPQQKSALVCLASSTRALITQDVALAASEAAVARISGLAAERLSAAGTGRGPPRDPDAVGWAIEGATLAVLTDLVDSSAIRPELQSILDRHLGEAGRHVSSLGEIFRARGLGDLEPLILRENFILLDDVSPPVRARAHGWLAARNRAPAGYDPFGPLQDRRAALDRAQATGNSGR